MNTNRKIYVFYFTVILLAVLAMMVFDLNIIIKAITVFPHILLPDGYEKH